MKRVLLLIVLVPLLAVTGLAQTSVFLSPGTTFTGSVTMVSAATLGWSDAFFCRGAASVIGLGGCTSSFPALKRNTAIVEVRLGDDSGFAALRGSFVHAVSGFSLGGGSGVVFANGTAASAPSSCGTSPAVTNSNGTVAWVVTGGTGGTATGCTVTMPAATTGWNCNVTNITQTAAHRADRATVQTASATTSVTFEYVIVSTGAATAFTASDVFRGICFAY